GGRTMAPYLSPIEKPQGLLLKIVYFFSRRQLGKVPTPVAVHSARMPAGFLSFYGNLSRLDKQLKLPSDTAVLIRERVDGLDSCPCGMYTQRGDGIKKPPDNLARLDGLPEHRTSQFFTDAERPALDYATELTPKKEPDVDTFARLPRHYSEREICDIVWLVAS